MSAPPCCAYCRSAHLRPWLHGIRDRLGCAPGEWSYDRCDECGSAMLRPVPEDLLACYPPRYSFSVCPAGEGRLRRRLSQLEYRLFYGPMVRRDVRRVVARVGSRRDPPPRLLDVACGRGLRLPEFRRLGYEVCAVDVQPEAVDYVQRELSVPAECASVEQLDRVFAPASFDVITAFYLIEHVVDVEGLLRRCRHLLRGGGWFVGTVPLADSFQAACFGARWSAATEAPRHVSLPSRLGLQRLCASTDWEDFRLQAHGVLACAGSLALSLVPGSNTSALYGSRRWRALPLRLLGGAVLSAAVPWCWVENAWLRRPAMGMLFMRKPTR